MTTAVDDNVHALAIEGTFDDCQALVKGLFNDHAFRDRVRLSGVNSINWARIVAQIVYYFTAAVALGAPHRKVASRCRPAISATSSPAMSPQRMGLPIDRLVVATNLNDILARTLATGTYELREVVATSSPSMDIQVSSNFERLLFEAYGREAAAGAALMASLAQSRRFSLSSQALSGIRALFTADRADEEETAATIRTTLRETRGWSIRTPPSALRSPRRRPATRRCRWWCSPPRIRPSSPTRSRRPAACGRAAGLAFRPT